MSRAFLSALCVLAFWTMPYWSIITSLFENVYQIFQQTKYIIPICICALFLCRKKELNELEKHIPLESMVTSAFCENSPRPWRQ